MLKTVIGLLTALFVAGFSPAHAQDASPQIPSQADFKALTDARIGVIGMACTDVARAKAKATGTNLIIDFLPS
jgi:hypothetical protein